MSRVLVTCVGSGIGQSVVDSLYVSNSDYIVGCDGSLDVHAAYYCDKMMVVPSIFSSGYVDLIVSLAVENDLDLVIPGHDYELLLFSSSVNKFSEKGIQLLVSGPEQIEISRNKYAWYKHYAKLGCSVVRTFSVAEFLSCPDESIFPAIIKPAGGSSSQGVVIVHSLEEVVPDASGKNIIQPYLFPEETDDNYIDICKSVNNREFVQKSEISIQLIFDSQSRLHGCFISKNILKNGVPVVVEPIRREEFPYYKDILKFGEVLESEKVKGPVNLQGRVTSSGLVFFEMNMRFTGITGNRALFGFNEVKWLVDNFTMGESSELSYTVNKSGVRQVGCQTISRPSDNSTRQYLVLGGGYVGGVLVERLAKESDVEVVIACRNDSFDMYCEKYSESRLQVISYESKEFQNSIAKSDVVINFIGALATCSFEDISNSILMQQELVERIKRANVAKVVNVSSQSVYNQSDIGEKRETDVVVVKGIYTLQKYLGEKMFDSIKDSYPNSKVLSVRLPRILGPDNKGSNGVFKNILECMKNGKEFVIPNPKNSTTVLDVDDAVDAIIFVVNNDLQEPVLNIGGVNIDLSTYVKAAEEHLGLESSEHNITLGKSEDVLVCSLVNGDLLNGYGWSCQKDIKQIISRL